MAQWTKPTQQLILHDMSGLNDWTKLTGASHKNSNNCAMDYRGCRMLIWPQPPLPPLRIASPRVRTDSPYTANRAEAKTKTCNFIQFAENRLNP
eukprot:7981809-Alexandrium_andersonii.AAC.3